MMQLKTPSFASLLPSDEFVEKYCVHCENRTYHCNFDLCGDVCSNFIDNRDLVDGPDEYSAEIDELLEHQADEVDTDLRCEICYSLIFWTKRKDVSPFKNFPICSHCFPQLSSDQLDRMKMVQDAGLSLMSINENFAGFYLSDKTMLQVQQVYPEIGVELSSNDLPSSIQEVEQDSWDVQQAKSYIQKIRGDIDDIRQKFWYIGFYLYECQMFGYYRALDYESIYEFAAKEFDFKRSTTKNLIGLIKAYSVRQQGGPSMFMEKKYQEYSQTQLVEMLPLSDDERELIKPDMTVSEIRAMKAALKNNPTSSGSSSGCDSSTPIETKQEDHSDEPVGNAPSDKVEVLPVDVPLEPGLLTWIPFNNDDARKKWLEAYSEWNVWYDIPDLNLTVYKWEFENGDFITVHTTMSVFAAANAVCHRAYYNLIIKDPVTLDAFRKVYGNYAAEACSSFDIEGHGGKAFAVDYLRFRKLKGVNMLCRKS